MSGLTTRTCGCIGCSNSAHVVIKRKGKRRTVCELHVNGYPVVENV